MPPKFRWSLESSEPRAWARWTTSRAACAAVTARRISSESWWGGGGGGGGGERTRGSIWGKETWLAGDWRLGWLLAGQWERSSWSAFCGEQAVLIIVCLDALGQVSPSSYLVCLLLGCVICGLRTMGPKSVGPRHTNS